MSLYKQGSVADEVMHEMVKNLKLNQLENKHAFSKLAAAIDHLANAAEIFDNTGYTGEAEVLVRLIERLSEKQAANQSLSPDMRKAMLPPKDREFLEKLPASFKARFENMEIRQLAEEVAKLRMMHELKDEIKHHNDTKPEVIEFESLLQPQKTLPQSDRMDDIIEFKSLKADDVVATAVAQIAQGKKKA
jgi:hypothetical protein